MNFLNKISIVGVLIATLTLSACAGNTPDLIVSVPKFISPPMSLIHCNLRELPSSFSTNKDVAITLNQVYNDNRQCKNNMDGIRSFVNDAQKKINTK
jgi:hypothetical protein